MSRITKAQLEARVAELELALEAARLERHIEESEKPEPPGVNTDIIANVRERFRADGTRVLNVQFVDRPVDGCALARALGQGLVWVAPEPRQDRSGRWWTSCVTTADARAASAQQYGPATLPPIEAYEDA